MNTITVSYNTSRTFSDVIRKYIFNQQVEANSLLFSLLKMEAETFSENISVMII